MMTTGMGIPILAAAALSLSSVRSTPIGPEEDDGFLTSCSETAAGLNGILRDDSVKSEEKEKRIDIVIGRAMEEYRFRPATWRQTTDSFLSIGRISKDRLSYWREEEVVSGWGWIMFGAAFPLVDVVLRWWNRRKYSEFPTTSPTISKIVLITSMPLLAYGGYMVVTGGEKIEHRRGMSRSEEPLPPSICEDVWNGELR